MKNKIVKTVMGLIPSFLFFLSQTEEETVNERDQGKDF